MSISLCTSFSLIADNLKNNFRVCVPKIYTTVGVCYIYSLYMLLIDYNEHSRGLFND